MNRYKILHIGNDETVLSENDKIKMLEDESFAGWNLVSVDNGRAYLAKDESKIRIRKESGEVVE